MNQHAWSKSTPLTLVLKLSKLILHEASPTRFLKSLKHKETCHLHGKICQVSKLKKRLKHTQTSTHRTYMRHSTLLPWLQNGQQKTASSLPILFLGGSLALDFLLPMIQSRLPSLAFLCCSITRMTIKIAGLQILCIRKRQKQGFHGLKTTH